MGLCTGLDHEVLASFGRLQTREGRLEDSIGTRGSGGFYIAIEDFDRRTRLRLAIDVSLTRLQDGVVREDGGELQVAGLDQRGNQQQEGGKTGHTFQTTRRPEGSQ